MPKKKLNPKTSCHEETFKIGDQVVVVDTFHAHVHIGDVGRVEEVLQNGYAVEFKETSQIGGFGGGKISKAAVVFMRFSDVAKFKPKGEADECLHNDGNAPAGENGIIDASHHSSNGSK